MTKLILTGFILLLGLGNLPANSLECCSETRFEIDRGFVIVQAKVNGMDGLYILDSGAPGLVLNFSDDEHGQNSQVELSGIGGDMNGYQVHQKTLQIANFEKADLEALAVDLNYIEKKLDRSISGLIGLDVFEGYDLVLDYQSNTFRILQNTSLYEQQTPFSKFPIVRTGHLLVIEIPYFGKKLNFGIDTGSRSNYISKSAFNIIAPWDCRELDVIDVIGSDQSVHRTMEVEITGLMPSSMRMEPAKFVVHDMNGIDGCTDVRIDGLLGHEFLKGRIIIIPKERNVIAISLVSPEMRNLFSESGSGIPD